jgi:hypothetical protein
MHDIHRAASETALAVHAIVRVDLDLAFSPPVDRMLACSVSFVTATVLMPLPTGTDRTANTTWR